jgi:hypothetical protein
MFGSHYFGRPYFGEGAAVLSNVSLAAIAQCRVTTAADLTTAKPNRVIIAGSIYNASTGAKVTSGALYLTPRSFIQNGGDVIGTATVSYSIPGSGNISLYIAPSNGVIYDVEFDPNPADPLPLRLRSGYWKDQWIVPGSGPVDIATL